MKKVELTVIKSIKKGEDSFSEIVALGFDVEKAKLYIKSALKYAGTQGVTVHYFSAEGIEVPEGIDEHEFAESQNWTQAIIMEYGGRYYALPDDYDVYRGGGFVAYI